MLLESRIDDRTTILIDAEASAGIDKGGSMSAHPDKVVPNGVTTVRAVAKAFADGLVGVEGLPPELELSFSLRVDSHAVVSLSRNPNEGQFRVTMRWRRD